MIVGVIDDRDDERNGFVELLQLRLDQQQPDCEVLSSRPFADIGDYANWINEEDVHALIIDENLKENAVIEGKLSKFFGHEVVTEIRKTHKELPIFMLATAPRGEGLLTAPWEYERVIPRADFPTKSGEYTEAILRITSSYLDRHREQLGRLAELSERLVTGKGTADDEKEIHELQESLAIPYYILPDLKREKAIDEYGKAVSDMKNLVARIEKYLSERK